MRATRRGISQYDWIWPFSIVHGKDTAAKDGFDVGRSSHVSNRHAAFHSSSTPDASPERSAEHDLSCVHLTPDIGIFQTHRPEPNAKPEGYVSAFAPGQAQEWDYDKIDYKQDEPIVTTLPQPVTMALARDGKAECMCTGWFKRMVMSTPGFPSPILHPPKMVYEVRQVQGRGLGVLATEDIKAGDLILAERPLLVKMMWNPVRYWKDMTEEEALRGAYVDLENTMEYICSRLTPKDLEAYKSLHNSHDTGGAGPLTGIWRTNGFKLGVKDPSGFDDGKEIKAREYSGVGANASRINHSCSPNAAFSFDMPSFSMEINALRPISKGEEITVAYCAVKIPAAERQNALKPYRFTCTCPACMNPEVSDKERKAAAENLLPKTSQGVKHAEEILAAYEATGLQCLPRYAELLRRVAQINRKKGYKKRADELDAMADIASGKRPRDRTPSTLGSPPEARFMDFGSEEDMMRSIMQIGNPAELANMMSALMRM